LAFLVKFLNFSQNLIIWVKIASEQLQTLLLPLCSKSKRLGTRLIAISDEKLIGLFQIRQST
jgi:hypothetical protein